MPFGHPESFSGSLLSGASLEGASGFLVEVGVDGLGSATGGGPPAQAKNSAADTQKKDFSRMNGSSPSVTAPGQCCKSPDIRGFFGVEGRPENRCHEVEKAFVLRQRGRSMFRASSFRGLGRVTSLLGVLAGLALVTAPAQVSPGDSLVARLASGHLDVTVDRTHHDQPLATTQGTP